jgi:hypothetical protein
LSSGWFPDPTGRYEYRYFNGVTWTADVSVHGQRYVDPLPPAAPGQRRPSRGFAIASFVVASASVLAAWLPFFFVAGLVGGITALVFGIIALRNARRHQGYGKGFAWWGVGLSVAALLLCIVGFMFTRTVLRQLDRYSNPGPHHTQVVSCSTSSFGAEMHGTITNLDTSNHEYNISVAFTSSGGDIFQNVRVPAVAPNAIAEFSSTSAFLTTGSISCRIDAVYGPEPFING